MSDGAPFKGLAFADVLTSGLTGRDLTAALWAHFADIKRPDVFAGARLAASIWAADLIEARAERDVALAERDSARLDLDGALIRLECLRAQIERMGAGSWLEARPAPQREAANG